MYFFILNTFTTMLLGQQLDKSFNVIDSDTNEGIHNAHVRNSENQIIAITNDTGEFFYKPAMSQGDSIKVSCLGYKTHSFILGQFQKQKNLPLVADTVILEEVIVNTITPLEIIKNVISAIPTNYQVNNVAINGTFNLSIEKDTFFVYNSRSKVGMKMTFNKSTPSFDVNPVSQVGNLEPIEEDSDFIKDSFLFDHIIHGRGFLNVDNFDSWKYEIEQYTLYEGNEVAVINATFISTNHISAISTKAKVTSHFGRIYVNLDDFAILKIEYDYLWNKMDHKKSKMDSLWLNNKSWTGYAYYTKRKHKYQLLNLGYTREQGVYTKSYSNRGFIFEKRYGYHVVTDFVSE